MSSSEKKESLKGRFHIAVVNHQGEQSFDTKITVYDGWDEFLKAGQGEVGLELPRGLYTVRAERAGMHWEKVIRHEADTRETIQEPLRVSATPVFDTATTHEYYANPSIKWSLTDTRPPIGDPNESMGRLFLFLRTPSQEQYRDENLGANLRLLNSQGELLSDFATGDSIKDDQGFLAFSARAERGLYILRHEGEEPREVPLYVYPELNTQVFLVYNRGLRFETAKIFLPSINFAFSPQDRFTQVADAALTTLQQGGDFFPEDAMNKLLIGKFEDPMLGFLGAHLLLRQKSLDESYLWMVIQNLKELVSSSPDFQALEIMACERLGRALPLRPFDQPPMLRPGLEAVLRLSNEYPELVPEKGLVECIATRLYVDSPWTSWNLTGICEQLYGEKGILDEVWLASDWLATYLKDAIQDKIKWKGEIDLKELARQVGVPTNLVVNMYEALGGSSLVDRLQEWGDDFKKISGIGPAFESALKNMGIRTYEDLAQLGEDKIEEVSSALGRFANRLLEGDWVNQAKNLLSDAFQETGDE